MSYPRNKAKFDAWHKAMVAGATVDKPNYGKTTTSRKPRTTTRRRRRKRKKKNGSKD